MLIAGGLGKGQDLAPLAAGARGKLRAAVLIGAAAAELAPRARAHCQDGARASMDEAVARAAELAQRGDTVLLSPACASQDMFRDYRERGELFARAAQELAGMSAVVKPNAVAFDAALICAVVGLIAMGTIMVTSASVSIVADEPLLLSRAPSRAPSPSALAGLALVVSLPTELWYRLSWLLLIAGFGLLVLVLVPAFGHAVNGSRRWLAARTDHGAGVRARAAVPAAVSRELRRAPLRRSSARA